jgi:hypothetical protein
MAQQVVKFTHIQGCKREHGSLKCSNSNYKKYLQKKAAVRLHNELTTRFGLKLQRYKRTRVKYSEEASCRLLSTPTLPCTDGEVGYNDARLQHSEQHWLTHVVISGKRTTLQWTQYSFHDHCITPAHLPTDPTKESKTYYHETEQTSRSSISNCNSSALLWRGMTSLQTVPPTRHYTTSVSKNLGSNFILSDRLAAPSMLSSPHSTTLTYNIGLYRTEGNTAVAITTPRCLHHIPSSSITLLRYAYLSFTLWLPVLPHTNIA